jgi:Mg/Co/Ni transporter MgtE
LIDEGYLPIFRESESGSCKKYLTKELAMGIFVGLVICGIPLAVMSALYAEKSKYIISIHLNNCYDLI